MSFSITVAGIEELSAFQMTTDVSIERRIYDHSRARITFEWVEDTPHSERRIAALAAACLNCTADVQWKGYGAAEAVPCFHGYVEQAAADRAAGRSRLTLDCVSMSKRADLAPRYRAFQACQLLDICRQVAKAEPLIKIGQAGDLSFDIPLSVQYGETDYAYLSRMLHAWGIPMVVSDTTGQVTLGARGVAAGGEFPDLDFRWSEVSFSGGTGHYPKRQNAGSGPSHAARAQVEQLSGQVKATATAYYPIPDSQPTRERHSAAHSQSDTSCYRLTFAGGVLPFSPGDVVAFEGQDHIVRAVRITGHPTVSTATQELELQPYTLPYAPEQHPPQWASRTLWAWVVANEHDPAQRGRIQVAFDLESLDPQGSSEKVWLHTLTPYGGGKSPSDGKAGSYNGIYSLPEVGERVLVEFLGDWDSEAVVIGTVRQSGVAPLFNAADTKRWRLPSGTELAMTSQGSTEVVRLRCKDKIFLECKLDGANAEFYMTPGESDDDIIHFKRGGGPASLYVQSGGTINVVAKQALHLEGQQVQITASGGMVNIDGAPNVMLNCGPTPAQPLQIRKFQEAMGSTSGENRVLPSPIIGTAASGGGSTTHESEGEGTDKTINEPTEPVPPHKNIVKPAHFVQEQNNSCVIASTRNMIHQMTGKDIPEAQLRNEMRQILDEPNHDFNTDPINPSYAAQLLKNHGVDVETQRNLSLDQLAGITAKGKPALIGFTNPGHRVLLDSVSTGSDGQKIFNVRDPDPAYGGQMRNMTEPEFATKYNQTAVVIAPK